MYIKSGGLPPPRPPISFWGGSRPPTGVLGGGSAPQKKVGCLEAATPQTSCIHASLQAQSRAKTGPKSAKKRSNSGEVALCDVPVPRPLGHSLSLKTCQSTPGGAGWAYMPWVETQ